MILKGSACEGCPFYTKGKYFTPDTIIPNSKVYFLAQNPGANEEEGNLLVKKGYGYNESDVFKKVQPQPLIGATGKQFTERFLPLAGLKRGEISLGNAIRCRPGNALGQRADFLPGITKTMKLESSEADIVKALKHCRDTHMHIPSSVDTIVTMGRHAMFALTGIQQDDKEYGKPQGVVESWRGYAVDSHSNSNGVNSWNTIDTSRYHPLTGDKRIFFTMHIAALFKGEDNTFSEGSYESGNKKYFHATLEDFGKLKRLLTKQWPSALPTWLTKPPEQWPGYTSFDTEYIPDTNELVRWSMVDTEGNAYCIEAADTPSVIPVTEGATVLAQNWLADYPYFKLFVDVSKVRLEDLMLAHSVLWTGEPHNLNYIQSIYGTLNRTKHLSVDSPQLYSATDATEPMNMWRGSFIPMFKDDPLSWKVYRRYRMPLIQIIDKAQRTGQKLESSRLEDIQGILKERLEGYQQRARELTNDEKFNLGGRKKMMEVMYGA